jgi:hypothetical protein
LAILRKSGLKGIGRFFYDSRKFKTISKDHWKGHANGQSLDHWAISQAAIRSGTVPPGLANGGWNLLQLPSSLNRWLGFAPNWGGAQAVAARAARAGIQLGVPSVATGAGYAGFELGTRAQSSSGPGCGCE